MNVKYKLYYWPSIQGRGEFVRLALEQAGAAYIDVARKPARGVVGMPALRWLLEDAALANAPFAPPFLQAGELLIAQTANILQFLGSRHDLAPKDEAGRLWTQQLQLTIADLVGEAHDTHHPISVNLHYESQKPAARRRAADFRRARLPKYLGYFERVLAKNPAGWLAGNEPSYADLSMFQVIAGLRHAFPRAMHEMELAHPLLVDLHARVEQLPRIAAYLRSKRRIAFNQQGIFRRYPELDG